jgi:hypothetical protein
MLQFTKTMITSTIASTGKRPNTAQGAFTAQARGGTAVNRRLHKLCIGAHDGAGFCFRLAGLLPRGALARHQVGHMLAQFGDIAADMAGRDPGPQKFLTHSVK